MAAAPINRALDFVREAVREASALAWAFFDWLALVEWRQLYVTWFVVFVFGLFFQLTDPAISFNYDGVYVGRPSSTSGVFYDLQRVELEYVPQIPAKEVRGVYKSTNRAYDKLLVVDKFNGGKADALNVGTNLAQYPYIVCIDVDCIMDKDSLLRLAKPFLEQPQSLENYL